MMRRLAAAAILFCAPMPARTCTVTALDLITTDWQQHITYTVLRVQNGPAGAAHDFIGNATYGLAPLADWIAALPTVQLAFGIDRSLNLLLTERSGVMFQLRATYQCTATDGAVTTEYYNVPFLGSGEFAQIDVHGVVHSEASIGGMRADGVMYYSHSTDDNYSWAFGTGFGALPAAPPIETTAAQYRTTVRRAAVKGKVSVR